ncbi:MAG: transferase hexapeptide repeat family protein [Bacteroidetes bacterium]|nr:transferase hexapeptide repeat family protein [Bacteroidota bacterium]MBM3424980.1 transferase hexapeptide repeat family protein [Bacteroidota bacterium]
MASYSFNGFIPVVHPAAFVHQTAVLIGDVIVNEDCYIGPGAVIRGDWGRITLEPGCNVQENCVVHMFPGMHIVFERGAHVGHGAIIHGAHLKKNCLIGMNAVVMDGAVVGENSIVGALSFVKSEEIIPDNHLFAGNPGKIIRALGDEQIAWKTSGTALYQSLPKECHATLLPVEPLIEMESNRPSHTLRYRPWKKT